MCSADSARLSLFQLFQAHTSPHSSHELVLAAAFALEAASTVHAVAIRTIDPAQKLKRSHFENLVKRQSYTTDPANESTDLNDALALQHLEANFYAGGLAKFDQNSFDQAGYQHVRPLLEQIAQDEADHVDFFTAVLKAANFSAVQACNYTFPYEDVTGYLRLAQTLEHIVVSALDGAASTFPQSPRSESDSGAEAAGDSFYPGAPATILTVDARYSAFLQLLHRESPFPSPMDTPLSARTVVTVLKPFTERCPSDSVPNITPFPTLNFTSSEFFSNGKVFVGPVNASAVDLKDTVYWRFALGLSANFSVWSNGSCNVPLQNVIDKGQSYIFLTKEQSVGDDSVLAGPWPFSLSTQNVTFSIPNGTVST